jgi:hypothetical protein
VTGRIPGIKELHVAANNGSVAAKVLLQEVAQDNLRHLLSGMSSVKVVYTPSVGLYDRSIEPSMAMKVTFNEDDRIRVLAAVRKFAENFNQEQFHVRQPVVKNVKQGTKFDDGSYVTKVYRWQLNQALTQEDVQKIIDNSGIAGLTFNDDYIEAYYVAGSEEEINDAERFKEFTAKSQQINADLGRRSSGIHESNQRLWPYGTGWGARVGYGSIDGDIPATKNVSNVVVKKIADYLQNAARQRLSPEERSRIKDIKPFKQAKTLTAKQQKLQEMIAKFQELVPDNDMRNPFVKQAYEALADEVYRQYTALPINVEMLSELDKNGDLVDQYHNSSAAMRKDLLDNNHLYIYPTTPDTFGPKGQDFSKHPLLQDSGLTDSKGNKLLYNDLLRAVHDYFAHGMTDTTFGPLGEEAGWKIHMSMTPNPLARWALTSETRAQNSWVNFREGINKDVPLKDRPFSPQKASLLPLDFAFTGDEQVDEPVKVLYASLTPEQRLGSKPRKKKDYDAAVAENEQNKAKNRYPSTLPAGDIKLSYAPRKVTAVFGGRTIPAQWSSPASNRMLQFVYDYQDKFVDLKNIIGEVNKINGQISDDMNAYTTEELFHGKVAKQTLDFNKRELAPLLKEMQILGIEDGELQKYLWNRHAEERNDKVASINANFSDMGSGIATADAKAYLASIPAAKKAKLDRIAARVDKIVKETKDLMEQQGLITPEIRKQWDASYKYYVPLQREEKDYEGAGMGMGQGFSVTPSVKRAMGSTLPVENILANVIASRERTIVRAEKNIVAKALFSLAVKSPNPNFWIAVTPSALKAGSKVIGELQRFGFSLNEIQNIAAEPTVRYVSDSGFVEDRINPALRNRDNVLHLMIDGREHLVIFNQADPTANRLSKALKNIDAGTMGIAMSTVASVTRWFAAINTQYNPIFGIINLLRDQSTAMFNLSTTPIAGMQKQVYGNSLIAMKGIWEQLRAEQRGQSATSQWGKLFEEFEKEGGPTGYRDMFASSQDRADAIASEFKQLREGKIKKGGRAILQLLSDYNTALENGVRLSAYKAALDKGLSKQKAASIAKNLTVNFNRKGDVTMQMNALFAFFNASVQGSARLIETLRGPAGRKIIYGGLTLGMLQAVALMAAGFDDEEPPEFIKERNIIIPTGGGKYITIPMPLGFNVIPNAGRVITDLVLRKDVNVPKKLSSLIFSTVGAFNPVGGGTLSQVLAPTVVDPIFALAENKDNFGRPIAKEDVSGLRPTPGYLRTKETATPWAKGLSKFLNYASGGTEFKKGVFSPTPDQIDYLAGVATGGLGREISKGAQTVGATISGEELPTYKIPLVSRFYGNTNEAASVASKFYENIKELNEHAAEIKGRRETRQNVGEYIKDNPEARLTPMATGIYNIISNLNKQKKMALERGLPRERIKQIETQMQMQMKRLNDRVREIRQ